MNTKMTDSEIKHFISFQVNEITESIIYKKLSLIEKNEKNKKTLLDLSLEEMRHYEVLRKYTGIRPKPKRWKITWYYLIARIFGITFGIKLMERGEVHAQISYQSKKMAPELESIAKEEKEHEALLVSMINEERLEYMGSVVLGLNDALVEFTGALAGFTLALQNPKLVALTGAITGIAAALSMASSEYLSTKTEGSGKNALKAAIYTGIAYIFTVVALVLPFALLSNVLVALAVCLVAAVIIIAVFNYYYSIATDTSFKHRFIEMTTISFVVAGISFIIGYALKEFAGIEV